MPNRFRNNPHRSHHARRPKWFPFLALAVCLLLPAKLQAGDPIPGVDVSLEQIPGGISVHFDNKVRFRGLVGDEIDVTTTNYVYSATNLSFHLTAGGVPNGQIVIVEANDTNDFSMLTATALGAATVSVISNELVVGNLGTEMTGFRWCLRSSMSMRKA